MAKETLAARVAGSNVFAAVWELAEAELATLQPAGVERFYELLREKVNARFPPAVVDPRDRPMTDAEAKEFGDQLIRFGSHEGDAVKDVPFDYLVWLAETKDEFKDHLRRYLKHPKVQQEVRRFYNEQGGDDDESVSTEA